MPVHAPTEESASLKYAPIFLCYTLARARKANRNRDGALLVAFCLRSTANRVEWKEQGAPPSRLGLSTVSKAQPSLMPGLRRLRQQLAQDLGQIYATSWAQ